MNKFEKNGEYYNAINKTWVFFKKHQNAKTDNDWDKIVKNLFQFQTKLEIDLAVAVVNEIERIYKLNEK